MAETAAAAAVAASVLPVALLRRVFVAVVVDRNCGWVYLNLSTEPWSESFCETGKVR